MNVNLEVILFNTILSLKQNRLDHFARVDMIKIGLFSRNSEF